LPDKVNGKALFGIDARLPNMGVATVAQAPVAGGKLKTVDDKAAMAMKGVRQVLRLDNAVAVVADHMWAAKQGLAAAAPTWGDGPNANMTTAAIVADMMKASAGTGAVAHNTGDALKGLAASRRRIDAVYEMPFLAHATMEPMNCTVDLRADGCDLWVGTQVPALAQGATAKLTGLPLEKVQVHNYFIGGGFGRRLEVDYVVQAVAFAKLAKGPVKFIWTREEDVQHDMLRPYYVDRLSAHLHQSGMPAAWFHRVTGSSIMARFAPGAVKDGVDPDAVEGARDLQYTIPDMRVEYVRHEPPVATAFWRGVGPTHNVFVVESFIDELAHAARQDPVAYRRALLKKSPRLLAVLNLAAEKSGWGQPLKPVAGRKVGRGVSAQFAFGSYMAQVADVSVGRPAKCACTAWCARSTAARRSTRTPSSRKWKAASCSAPRRRCGAKSRTTRGGCSSRTLATTASCASTRRRWCRCTSSPAGTTRAGSANRERPASRRRWPMPCLRRRGKGSGSCRLGSS